MPDFRLYTSNRQEELIHYLADHVLTEPLENPLTTELIVVQHHGIQRWVSLELARKHGILANTRFLFPNELNQILFETVIPEYSDTWNPERLHWHLFDQLLALPEHPKFNLIQRFQSGNKELKSFQLARQLSNLFDQYDMFRSEMLDQWESGSVQSWQSTLYRALPEEVRKWRKSRVKNLFLEQLNRGEPSTIGFPERITFFGISYLPPLHLEILKGLSRLTNVHFFFLNPSPYFWGDLLPEKRIIKETLKKHHRVKDDLHFDEGNALLASWGKYGQDFFTLLYDMDISQEADIFVSGSLSEESGDSNTLLGRIQSDIFELLNPDRTEKRHQFDWLKTDDSLRIHSCHSSMREVEVLRNQLLMIFSGEDIQPENVLVMTPDINHYAPLIQAVFTGDPKDKNFIPYSITDRVFIKESVVIQYFLKLFDIAQSRFTLSDGFALMASQAVRDKFQLSTSDIDQIRGWMDAVNVRWGINSGFREAHGVPPTYENTWEFGFDRLLTGFAIPAQGSDLVREQTDNHLILPFDHIEGNNALILGRFLDYFNFMSNLSLIGKHSFSQQRTISRWCELFETILRFLFKEHVDWANELIIIRQACDELVTMEKETRFAKPIGSDPLLEYFKTKFNGILNERGYMGQGVTFAAMKPMRSVPFKVIALIGMNDKSFPRTDQALSFDLVDNSIKGDRSVKGEDQYLFLETLLCARKKLLLSYIGQSIKDNAPLPPSTLIAELRDYLEQAYLTKDEIHRHIIVNHPLQAFNPKNFIQGSGLFSFSEQNLLAAKSLVSPVKKQRTDLRLTLPEPDDAFKEVSIEQLANFFDNPAKYLLNRRLNIYLEDEAVVQPDHESFTPDSLSRYSVEGKILECLTPSKSKQTMSKQTIAQIIRSQGVLPHVQAGKRLFDEYYSDLLLFSNEIEPYINQSLLEPLPFEIPIGRFILSGIIHNVGTRSLFHYRQARVKVRDRMKAWLEHLVINHLNPKGYPLESVLIGKNSKDNTIEGFNMEPVAGPASHLKNLLDIYYEGLSRVLAFFPRTAAEYMSVYQIKASEDEPLARSDARSKAQTVWGGHTNMSGESENRYFQLCFGNRSIFDDSEFESNCLNILKPIYDQQLG